MAAPSSATDAGTIAQVGPPADPAPVGRVWVTAAGLSAEELRVSLAETQEEVVSWPGNSGATIFSGRDVVLFPTAPGKEAAILERAKLLHKLGARVTIHPLNVQHVAAHFVPATELVRMAGEAPRWAPDGELVAVSLGELLALPMPPREMLMDPFLRRKDLLMTYGPRGHGKTWVSLGVACAVASGAAFTNVWRGHGAHRVLLVDGELPAEDLQRKLAVMARAINLTNSQATALPRNLRIITPDLQHGFIPDLSTTEGQEAIDPHLDGVALLILDNLSTLCGGADENDATAWQPMGTWLQSLRRRNMAVMFVHHAGRNAKNPRGHSKREDPLDWVISICQPHDYHPDDGARFEVEFKKARHKMPAAAAVTPFELRLDGNTWTSRPLERAREERVREMLEIGMSADAIAGEVGVNRSTIYRLARKLGHPRGGRGRR